MIIHWRLPRHDKKPFSKEQIMTTILITPVHDFDIDGFVAKSDKVAF